MAETIANFDGMDKLGTVVYDAAAIDTGTWSDLQYLHRDSLRAHLPKEDWQTADAMVHIGRLDEYKRSRLDPNVLVGNPWNDDQLFRRPLVAVTFDGNSPVGATLSADNTSANHAPKRLRPVELWAKMLAPQGVAIPLIGNARYTHVRETFTHPDAQPKPDSRPQTKVVSGIAVNGLYQLLKANSHREQTAATYLAMQDPVDAELIDLATLLDMRPRSGSGEQAHTIPHYRSEKLLRVQKRVGDLLATVESLPGVKLQLTRRVAA